MITQGKWEAKLNRDESWVVMNGNTVIATFHLKDWPEWNKSNAYLIAAAPELLKSCKELLVLADNGSAEFDDPEPDSPYLTAIQLIAEVEGK